VALEAQVQELATEEQEPGLETKAQEREVLAQESATEVTVRHNCTSRWGRT